jgi:hypothetical protein
MSDLRNYYVYLPLSTKPLGTLQRLSPLRTLDPVQKTLAIGPTQKFYAGVTNVSSIQRATEALASIDAICILS